MAACTEKYTERCLHFVRWRVAYSLMRFADRCQQKQKETSLFVIVTEILFGRKRNSNDRNEKQKNVHNFCDRISCTRTDQCMHCTPLVLPLAVATRSIMRALQDRVQIYCQTIRTMKMHTLRLRLETTENGIIFPLLNVLVARRWNEIASQFETKTHNIFNFMEPEKLFWITSADSIDTKCNSQKE